MGRDDSLRTYRGKRDFDRTRERSGAGEPAGQTPRFVVQIHDARRMHFDFRLQVGDVLKSWSIPRGPSADPKDKRLAVPTEDHPLEYADFEGTIPEDEYGGGTVIVWDAGSYRNLKTDGDGKEIPVEKGVEDGEVNVYLEGRKLKGGYALIRTGRRTGGKRSWLLVKMKDDEADARRNPVSTEPRSVLSGRTIREVAEEDDDGGDSS